MDESDKIALLEMARVALTRSDMRERIAIELDLSDEEIARLEKVNRDYLGEV